MKKLLCILLFLFPVVAYSQNQSEWERQSAEQQIMEYYQSKLNAKNDELRKAQNELNGLLNLSDSEFTEDVKSRGAYLGAKIEVLKAEKKALENKLRELQTQTQTTAKSVQSQKSRQQKNAARQKQNQSRQTQRNAGQSATDAQNEKDEAARKAKEEAARKAKEEQAQACKAQFNSNKQKAMQTSESYYNTQRAYVEHTASPQAFAQVSAQVSNNQVQRTLSNVPSGKSGKQMPGNSTFNKLQQRNRGEAVNGVYLVNQQESTILFEQKLAARTAAGEGRYDENWLLEQKKEALSIWLGSDAKMQKLSKNNMEKNLVNGLKTVSANAQRDQATFMSASGAERDRALQRQYRGAVPDREYTEPYFLSKLDASEQSRVIDALVVQSKDKGLVNPDILKKVVNKVDYGVARNNGKDLEGSDDLTQRANAVLEALRKKCAGGFCNKQYQEK